MDTFEDKKKLFELLFQLDDYYLKIKEISKEIEMIINKLELKPLNLESYIEQLNHLNKTMKTDIYNYYNKFRTNKVNTPEENDLKIFIGFKQPSGEVHTFEAGYGTTVDKLINTYSKVVMKDKIPKDIIFEYEHKILNLGDMTPIENIFNDKQNPTVIIRKREDMDNLDKKKDKNYYTDFNFISNLFFIFFKGF